MLTPEERVCELEFAKKLKKLGVRQDSQWFWVELYKDKKVIETRLENQWGAKDTGKRARDWQEIDGISAKKYSAYAVAELMNILPQSIIKNKNIWYLTIEKSRGLWWICYRTNSDASDYIECNEKLADACAKVLIYLLKKGLVNVEDVNG